MPHSDKLPIRERRLVIDSDPLLRRYEWTCDGCGRCYGVHEVRCNHCDPYPLPPF